MIRIAVENQLGSSRHDHQRHVIRLRRVWTGFGLVRCGRRIDVCATRDVGCDVGCDTGLDHGRLGRESGLGGHRSTFVFGAQDQGAGQPDDDRCHQHERPKRPPSLRVVSQGDRVVARPEQAARGRLLERGIVTR